VSTVKNSFIEYLKTKSPSNSGKPSSYAKAMEVLEDVLFSNAFSKEISIWTFINNENVDSIYDFVKVQQKLKDGIFKNYTPSSYWESGYCSAALKEFGEYLAEKTEQNKEEQTQNINVLNRSIPVINESA
jgi:hypothetical protein